MENLDTLVVLATRDAVGGDANSKARGGLWTGSAAFETIEHGAPKRVRVI